MFPCFELDALRVLVSTFTRLNALVANGCFSNIPLRGKELLPPTSPPNAADYFCSNSMCAPLVELFCVRRQVSVVLGHVFLPLW